MSKNYYQILGVRHSASQDELKKAYRKLASMYHPDKYPDDTKFAEDMMKQINIAYDFLSDSTKKTAYDEWLKNEPPQSGSGATSSSAKNENETSYKRFRKIYDVLRKFTNDYSGYFVTFFIIIFVASLGSIKNDNKVADPLESKQVIPASIDTSPPTIQTVHAESNTIPIEKFSSIDVDTENEILTKFNSILGIAGMSAISADIEDCYKKSSVISPKSIQSCMLYDGYAIAMDDSIRKELKLPPVTAYLTVGPYNQRLDSYASMVFKGYPLDDVKNYLHIEVQKLIHKYVGDERLKRVIEMSEDEFSNNFRCPETYLSETDKASAIDDEFTWLTAHLGSVTIEQIVDFRMKLLKSHQCEVTLNNISNNNK